MAELPPPPYPFAVDHALAAHGKEIFVQQNCNVCHAQDGQRTGQIIPVAEPELGTDRHRLDMWTKEAADKYNQFAQGYPWAFHDLRESLTLRISGRTPGWPVVACPVLAQWFRALTNRPADRSGFAPKEVPEGYDVYDQANVGFVSQGAEAARVGFEYDTSLPGNGNQGHTYGTTLPPEEKRALIEYLKTL